MVRDGEEGRRWLGCSLLVKYQSIWLVYVSGTRGAQRGWIWLVLISQPVDTDSEKRVGIVYVVEGGWVDGLS